MANEFIARKGLIVLSNGAKITGSVGIQGDTNATGYAVTASYFVGDGSFITNIPSTLAFSGSSGGGDLLNLKTDTLRFSGSNGLSATVTDNTVTFGLPTGTVTASSQVDHNATTNYVANQHIDHTSVSITAGSGLNGGGDISATRTLSVNSGSMLPYYSSSIFGTVSGDILITAAGVATIQANSVALGTDTTGNYVATITAGSGIATTGASTGETIAHTISLDTSSAHFTSGVKGRLNAEGVVSSSTQVVGYGFATTASNTFTGVQTLSNTTNSTNFTNGALIVQGGVGIAKDVNISGSLTVTGLLTAVSMSVQYVTSSEYTVGTSKIILNDDDLVRFAGISVVDSGSSQATGSLYWDSFRNHWLYENESGSAYNSALLIAGPKHTGSLGGEVGLISGRIPVASGEDHIDTNPALTPLRVEGTTLHAEGNVYVTGSVTASGFSGDGSNLTGLVTNLNIAANGGGTSQVSLKTETLQITGSNGIVATAAGDGFTISGSDATTTTKGVASFNSTNFTVTGGAVSSNNISINGTNVTLGGTRNITLSEITAQGATTANTVTFNGGAIIHGVLYTSGSNTDVDTGTEVVAAIPTGSYDAAHFDYVIKNGANLRTGTVMVVWDALGNVEFTDTSTNDLGNTAGLIFTADILVGSVRLKATVDSNDWIVKTAARLI